MLILSRRPGDSILIGDGIRIVVIASDRRGATSLLAAMERVRDEAVMLRDRDASTADDGSNHPLRSLLASG